MEPFEDQRLVASEVVDSLAALGVETVFGLPGVHNLPIWHALETSDIRLIGVRHEQTAVYAADGLARATGRLGVAIVTSGPGAANTLGATGEAMASHSPVLVVATDIPERLRVAGVYRGVLHETRDQEALFRPVTKKAVTVRRAEDVVPAVRDLAALAQAAPSGPVYLGIPADFLRESVSLAPDMEAEVTPAGDFAEDLLAEAVGLIECSTRPLIWAGGGAVNAGAGQELAKLAERLAAPVMLTFSGNGLLPEGHPCLVPGPVHEPLVGKLWDDADLVIAIGTDFDGMMTQNWAMPAPQRLLSLNADRGEAEKNYPPTVGLIGDARIGLGALLERIEVDRPLTHVGEMLSSLGTRIRSTVREEEPEAAKLLEVLARVLGPEAIVVADMCIAGYWIGGYRKAALPRKVQYPLGWGTLGFAFPASLGAAAADVGPTVCVAGDGGFLFACGDLATLAEADLPLTVVIVDDGGYGMLRYDQVSAGETPFGVDLVRPDFSMLATSFGIRSETVEGFGADFERALADALAAKGPRVVVVNVRLLPPPTTSPRWYRKTQVASAPATGVPG